MNTTIPCAHGPVLAQSEVTELVRGNERPLLDRILPLVRRQCVALDLRAVARIDAAGLAALIELYCAAHDAGHGFSVLNPSPHVAEFLAMVGLDKILAPRAAANLPHPRIQFEQTAA